MAILILGGIFALLFINAYPAFAELGILQFLGGAVWNPTSYSTPRYGILSLIVSSMMVTFGALVIAVPLGVACAAFISETASNRNFLSQPHHRGFSVSLGMFAAIYLHEYARPGRTTRMVRLAIRNLSGVPSIVYGLFGVVLFVQMMHLGTSIFRQDSPSDS